MMRNRSSRKKVRMKNRAKSTGRNLRKKNSEFTNFDEKLSKFISNDVDDFLAYTSPLKKTNRQKTSPSNTTKIWHQIKKIEDEESVLQRDLANIDRLLKRKKKPRKKTSYVVTSANKKLISKNRISELSKPKRRTKKRGNIINRNPKKRFSFSLVSKTTPEKQVGYVNENYVQKNLAKITPKKVREKYYAKNRNNQVPNENIDHLLIYHEAKYSEITRTQIHNFQQEMRKLERVLRYIQTNFHPLTERFESEFSTLHTTMSRMIRGSTNKDFVSNPIGYTHQSSRDQEKRRKVISLDDSDYIETKKLGDPESPFSRYPHGGGDIIVEETKTRRRGVYVKSPSQKIREINTLNEPKSRISIGDRLRRYSGILPQDGNFTNGLEDSLSGIKVMGKEEESDILFRALGKTNVGNKGSMRNKRGKSKTRNARKDRLTSNPFFLKGGRN